MNVDFPTPVTSWRDAYKDYLRTMIKMGHGDAMMIFGDFGAEPMTLNEYWKSHYSDPRVDNPNE